MLGREVTREIGTERLRRLFGVFRANRRPWTPTGRGPTRAGWCWSGRNPGSNGVKRQPGTGLGIPGTGGLTTHSVAGDHYSIMQRPAVERLAAILSDEIERETRWKGSSPMNLVRFLLRSSRGT